MNSDAPPITLCPHCMRPVGAASVVCGSCGAVLPIEGLLRKAGASMRGRSAVAQQIRVSIFLWLIALMPFAIVPPMVALAIVLFDTSRFAPKSPAQRAALIAVALLNIGLSVVFWIVARDPLLQGLIAIGYWLQEHTGLAVPADPTIQNA